MTAECHAGTEAEARVRPQPESAAASKKMEDANSPEAPGRTECTRRHSCLALFGFPTSELAEDKCVWFGATRSVAVCHSGHRKGTQPLTLRPPRPTPPSPQLLRLLLQPLPLGSGRTPRHLCSSKPPPHSSLHPVGT